MTSPFTTYRLDGTPADSPREILNDKDERVGIVTGSGPVFAADPAYIEDLQEMRKNMADAEKAFLAEKAKASKKQRMRELLDETMVSPRMAAECLNDLTIMERRIIETALLENAPRTKTAALAYEFITDYPVNLPSLVNRLSKRKEFSGTGKHALEVAVGRAARRLYNRGLATVEKRTDGLIWCTISRERLLHLIHKELAKKEGGGQPDINLIKVHCEIPTSSSGCEKRPPKKDPLDLPRRASPQRLAACRLLSGVRTLSRPDKVEINYNFDVYSEEVNSKIIALLDVRSGDIIGSEYSTRFNDLAKAARNLNRFDYAVERSFLEHSKAVFLTLTTDPNLTDGEKAAVRLAKLDKVQSKLRNTRLPKWERAKLEETYFKLMGPDFEMEQLGIRMGSGLLSGSETEEAKKRLAKLTADKEASEELIRAVQDPRTPIRTKERMATSLKKMNRWEYKHDLDGFRNLWEANRHFSKAWNKFLVYLTKNNDMVRPKYLATYEFTESGLLHVHAIIFVPYLMPYDKISREWRRCGQGEIGHIYGLKAHKDRTTGKWEWRWNSSISRPPDTKGMSGGDYLKKYVKKCMLAMMDDYTSPSEIQSLYWAFNKRFVTCSRSLLDGFDEAAEQTEKEVSEAAYCFFRILTETEAPDYVDRMVYHRIRPKWQKDEGPPDDDRTEGVPP